MDGCPTLPALFAGGWAFGGHYNLHECTSNQFDTKIRAACISSPLVVITGCRCSIRCQQNRSLSENWSESASGTAATSGYVVMPEHVHLLISEPERSKLSVVIQLLKQITSQKLRPKRLPQFWQVRYYDFPAGSPNTNSSLASVFARLV
jgi:hypothetical protein